MSLKHFHVFFIATSLGLMGFLLYWTGGRALSGAGSWIALLAPGAGFALGLIYLVWFLRKYRDIN